MGIGLRRFGQTIFERLSGARIHIDYPIAGGVSGSLSLKDRDYLLAQTKQQLKAAVTGLDLAKDYIEKGGQEVESFSKFRSMYMGLVNEEGNLEVYDGSLRLKSADGKVLEEVPSEKYASIINEGVEGWSYLKFPYYSKEAFPDGMYRVGPLGRLNVCDGIDTPLAREAAKEFKRAGGNRPVHSTMFYHWARMIELVHFMEKAQRILEDQSICGTDIVRSSQPRNTEGIGVTEAPRGTLIHHYHTNERGVITRVNLIVATGHNNLAMNRSVVEVARQYVDGGQIPEATLNRFEAAIRCYDPCLSCSTHAVGQMPLTVEVLSAKGELVQTLSR
jgi:NAD-reducing hydrogenase large subunit